MIRVNGALRQSLFEPLKAVASDFGVEEGQLFQSGQLCDGFNRLIRDLVAADKKAFKSIELGGSGTNVQLSFQLTAEAIRTLTPQHPSQEPGQPKQ